MIDVSSQNLLCLCDLMMVSFGLVIFYLCLLFHFSAWKALTFRFMKLNCSFSIDCMYQRTLLMSIINLNQKNEILR